MNEELWGFGFHELGFGFRVSGLRFRVSGFGYSLGVGCVGPCSGFSVQFSVLGVPGEKSSHTECF